MGTQIVVGDVVLLRSYCYEEPEAQLGINDYWYLCNAITGIGAEDIAAVQQWSTGIAPFLKDIISDRAEYQGASLNVYRPLVRPSLTVKSDNGNGLGTAAGGILPTQVCGILHKQSNTGGPGGRGRVYLPFPANTANTTEGKPDAAYLTDVALLAAFLDATFIPITGINSSSLIPVLYSRSTTATKAIIQWTPIEKWGTQKRRGLYGRQNPPFTV